jgi:hypothetical protein
VGKVLRKLSISLAVLVAWPFLGNQARAGFLSPDELLSLCSSPEGRVSSSQSLDGVDPPSCSSVQAGDPRLSGAPTEVAPLARLRDFLMSLFSESPPSCVPGGASGTGSSSAGSPVTSQDSLLSRSEAPAKEAARFLRMTKIGLPPDPCLSGLFRPPRALS